MYHSLVVERRGKYKMGEMNVVGDKLLLSV